MVSRWKTLSWMRRFWIVLGSLVVLTLLYLYGFENPRGTFAIRKAKLRAEKLGLSMDIGKRLGPDDSDGGVNFADCREVVQSLPEFDEFNPGFHGLSPHSDHTRSRPIPLPWRSGIPRELEASVSPLASSQKEAAERILGYLETYTDKLDSIEEASLATYCDFGYDWSQNIRDVRLFNYSPIIRWFCLRAYCQVTIGETEAAVEDMESLLRVARFMNEKPLWFHAREYRALSESTCEVVWAGLQEGRFSVEEMDRLIAAISNSGFRGFLVRTLINEEAWALRYAEQRYFSMVTRAAHESSYPPNYWPESVLASATWDDELLERAERLTYIGLPSGWFKQSQTRKFSRLVDIGVKNPSVLAMYRFSERGLRRDSFYDLVWKGSEFAGSYRDIAAVMINAETDLELALFALVVARARLGDEGGIGQLMSMNNRPIDPWAELPMKHVSDHEGLPIFYSIGQDGDDDGGRPLDHSVDGDLVWQYPTRE